MHRPWLAPSLLLLAVLLRGEAAFADEPAVPGEQNRVDVLAVVTAGEGLPEELADDVGEPLTFALGKETDRAFHFVPLEQARAALGYLGATSPGSCVFDTECVRGKKKALGADRFIVVRLSAAGNEAELTVTRVSDDAVTDVSRTVRVAVRASEIVNAARGLVLSVLEERRATLVLTVNEDDAAVIVGDVTLAPGKRRLDVKPGTYRVRVTKAEFTPFETTITCNAGEQCAVSASIFPERASTPTDAPDDTLSKSLIISGWSAAGVGAVLTAVGVVYGLQADELEKELQDACAGPVCTISRSDAETKRDDGRTAARVFNGAGISGMVMLVAGVTTAAVGHAIAPDMTESVDVGAYYVPGGGGVSATVRF